MLEATTGVMPTDEALVDQARAGDRSALADLCRRHERDAYRLAHRYLGNEQDALDALQEAMIKVITRIGEFEGRSGFRTWFFRIVTNATRDAGRKRKRRPTVSIHQPPDDPNADDAEPSVDHDPSLDLRRTDLKGLLDRALEKLSREPRETFLLFAEVGLSYKEIAEIQEVPIGTVMSRLYYARNKLQSALEGVEGL